MASHRSDPVDHKIRKWDPTKGRPQFPMLVGRERIDESARPTGSGDRMNDREIERSIDLRTGAMPKGHKLCAWPLAAAAATLNGPAKSFPGLQRR